MATFGGNDEGGERTEDPTPKRREQAREEGNLPRSQELAAATSLMAGAMLLASVGGDAIAAQTTRLFHEAARWLAGAPLSQQGAVELLTLVGRTFLLAVLPFLGALMAVGVAVGLVQSRGTIALKRLEPRLSNLNPVQGLARILGPQALFTLVKSLVKFVVLGAVTWTALRQAWPEVVSLTGREVAAVPALTQTLALRLAIQTAMAFLLIAVADYAFEVWQYEKGLKMTKQEVIQEHKESDGNPLIKSRIRSLQQAMTRKRMLGDVRKATVVITNPTHIAIALRYDAGENAAPTVLAMGERKLAERIKAIAAEAGIPRVENRPLARALLATARVGQAIPVDLYNAVAEVLAYVYRRQGRRPA